MAVSTALSSMATPSCFTRLAIIGMASTNSVDASGIPTCPSESRRSFQRGLIPRVPSRDRTGVRGASFRPPARPSTNARLAAGRSRRGTVANPRTSTVDSEKTSNRVSQNRWAAVSNVSKEDSSRSMRRSISSMVADETSSNLIAPSEHEPGVHVEAGPLLGAGHGDAERAPPVDEREPQPAADRMMPAVRRLSLQEDATDVGQAEHAELS